MILKPEYLAIILVSIININIIIIYIIIKNNINIEENNIIRIMFGINHSIFLRHNNVVGIDTDTDTIASTIVDDIENNSETKNSNERDTNETEIRRAYIV
jgi:hypothetical protein